MKKILVLVALTSLIFACKTDKKEPVKIEPEVAEKIAPFSDDIMETAVIYEANIRQYSPEGSFEAFTKDIPQLKELGVKIIWLMPIYPISETKRKATGGEDSKFASDFPEEEQAKYLGSYYAVTDYTRVNPEFGTIEDFRKLLKTAHDNDIYVILDWVPNHTGWDHVWVKTTPEYYTQKDGKIIHPEGTDWTDVADLNYDNQEMRKEMIEDMMYWITEEDVDGFRCDVAGSVPTSFWQQAIPQLREEKPIFMLAEAWEPALLKDNLFDMCYAWEGHHLMNDIAKGKKTVSDYKNYLDKISKDYESNDILMNFVTNHDENSWSGTVKERLGDASEVMTALEYITPGMPLIYSGQEYGLNHRLKFFEKDSIPKTKGPIWEVLSKLGKLKNTSTALNGGKNKAETIVLDSGNDNVLLLNRSNQGVKITFVANMSNQEQEVKMPEGVSLDYMTNKKMEFKADESFSLKPWQYLILLN